MADAAVQEATEPQLSKSAQALSMLQSVLRLLNQVGADENLVRMKTWTPTQEPSLLCIKIEGAVKCQCEALRLALFPCLECGSGPEVTPVPPADPAPEPLERINPA